MRDEDYARLLEDTQHELLAGAGPVGVLGLTPVTLRLLASLAPAGLDRAVAAVYAPAVPSDCPALTVPVRPFHALGEAQCGLLVVAADAEKEDLLCAALPFVAGAPKVIVRLGAAWPVIGFDTFGGFPSRRSPLDMYEHPGCVFTDLAAVRRYLDGRDIEIVPGDIAATCRRLGGEDLVLTFIDTDNHTPAKAALEVVRGRTVPGGAIVFDHFTGTSRFRYTLGERIAGRVLLDDARYFHLHGTGVFYRQPAMRGAGR